MRQVGLRTRKRDNSGVTARPVPPLVMRLLLQQLAITTAGADISLQDDINTPSSPFSNTVLLDASRLANTSTVQTAE